MPSGVPYLPETISRRRARLEDHLTQCKPISTRGVSADGPAVAGSELPANEKDDPAEFWGELLFFNHDGDAAEKAGGGGDGAGDGVGAGGRGSVKGLGEDANINMGIRGEGGDAEGGGSGRGEGTVEGGRGKGGDNKNDVGGATSFAAAFSAAAEKQATAEDLFDEDAEEEVIDMDAHPGFVKPAFNVDDCEPDCDDAENSPRASGEESRRL